MKKSLKRPFLFLLVLSVCFFGYGQIGPVSSRTVIQGPSPCRLSDLVDNFSEKLSLTLLLRDINVVQGEVYIMLHIENHHIKISTNPNYKNLTYYLDGGIPLMLGAHELKPYFSAQNLSFEGYSSQSYMQSGSKLPEGEYRLWFEVFEKKSSLKVSAGEVPAILSIQELEPPILLQPENNKIVYAKAYTNILFSWQPQHLGRPNSNFQTVYDFELVQIPQLYQGPPEILFNNFNILHETTTTNTTLYYDLSCPTLLTGYKYAFRVKARHGDINENINYFKNNGYSTVHVFDYLEECLKPMNISGSSDQPYTAQLQWTGDILHQSFFVFYRRQGVSDASWFSTQTGHTHHWIDDLSPNTTYEVKVKAVCENNESEESSVITIKTPDLSELNIKCGELPQKVSDSCKNLISELKVGDIINSGGSQIKITEINQSGTTFNGKGYFIMPNFNFIKLCVNFQNISVNTCYQHVAGVINSM